ncbi:MAG: hypothetical protein MUD08_03485 [Cytophagales bacterium]|nr:hypothetical protein [Cytophagales bacterium]
MKTFKTLDFMLQTLALIGGAAYWTVDGDFFLVYSLVGGVQAVSMAVHFFTGNVYPNTARSIYHWISLVAVASMFAVVGFWILLFLAPFMAVFYWSLCLTETVRVWERPKRIFA